jgi:hypothetical protein
MQKLFVLLLLVNLFGFSLFGQQRAQRMYEPKRGTAERVALMDAIREYDMKRDARLADELFQVLALRVSGIWAYAGVEQLPSGVISYGVAHVFVRKVRGKWQVEFSTFNDEEKVGVEGLEMLRKRHRAFPKALADFAMQHLAG